LNKLKTCKFFNFLNFFLKIRQNLIFLTKVQNIKIFYVSKIFSKSFFLTKKIPKKSLINFENFNCEFLKILIVNLKHFTKGSHFPAYAARPAGHKDG